MNAIIISREVIIELQCRQVNMAAGFWIKFSFIPKTSLQVRDIQYIGNLGSYSFPVDNYNIVHEVINDQAKIPG